MVFIGHKVTKNGLANFRLLLVCLVLTAGWCLAAEETAPPTPDDPNSLNTPADPNSTAEEEDVFAPKISTLVKINEAYQKIFAPEFITDHGNVRYADLRRKRSDLLGAIRELNNLNPAVLMVLSPKEKTAFWINTYNVCVLDLVIENYPIQHRLLGIFYPNNSIMQIPDDWRSDHLFKILGMEYKLQEIEEELLLQRTQDPRIIFALTHASFGGAMLRSEPYRAETLDDQLDDQVRRYLETPHGMEINPEKEILYLSNLFSMYDHKEFFAASEYAKIRRFRDRKTSERAWLNFIRDYISEDDVKYLETQDYDIKFTKYDWTLNEAN